MDTKWLPFTVRTEKLVKLPRAHSARETFEYKNREQMFIGYHSNPIHGRSSCD